MFGHFAGDLLQQQQITHLIAILLASIAIGCLPFVYLNLFKLYFDSQISSNYAFSLTAH